MDEELVDRIKEWQNGSPQPPYKVDLFLTQRCNLRCMFCEFPKKSEEELSGELSHDEVISLAEQAGKLGARIFGILGGEPFFRQNTIIPLMETIKKHGMRGSLVTNGTMITDGMAKSIARMEWDLLRISIDGDEKTHDNLRGIPGSFSRIVQTLEYFKKHKINHPTIEFNTVLCNKNIEKIDEVIRLAKEYDVRFVYILPMILFNESASSLSIQEKDYDKVKQSLEKTYLYAESLGVNTNLRSVIDDNLCLRSNETDEIIKDDDDGSDEFIPCFIPWYGVSVDAKGNATPCSQFSAEKGISIRSMPLKDIWYGEKFTAIRNRMKKNLLDEGCSRCCVPLLDDNKRIRELIT